MSIALDTLRCRETTRLFLFWMLEMHFLRRSPTPSEVVALAAAFLASTSVANSSHFSSITSAMPNVNDNKKFKSVHPNIAIFYDQESKRGILLVAPYITQQIYPEMSEKEESLHGMIQRGRVPDHHY